MPVNSDDIRVVNQNITQLIAVLRGVFPRVFGTFTMPAAATITVSTTAVTANCDISWTPTNASAGTLEGSAKALYISAKSPGVSFTLATASGGNAAGTESFAYRIFVPS